MSNPTIDRIKKLLALANNNPNEHEAARALELAQTLMMKHGIDAKALGEKAKIGTSGMIDEDHRWQNIVANAVAYLYGLRVVNYRNVGFQFAGRLDNIDAATLTLPFIANQIEGLYKIALPKGLTKAARGEFRRTFKEACAMRVNSRIETLVHAQITKDEAAKAAGGTALVVREHRKQLEDDAQEALNAIPGLRMKKSREIAIKETSGAIAGFRAGDTVKIHQEVK